VGIFNKNQIEYDDELNVMHEIIKTILYIATIVVLVFLILTFVGNRSEVIGHSMESTLHDGESVWLDKLTYRFKDPERFDIIVFPYLNSDTYYIKRIIGLPGETVYIAPDGTIYIGTEETIYIDENGVLCNEAQPLEESYGNEVIEEDMRGLAAEPFTLGDDEYFVMGDNRNNSQDSRYEEVGAVSKDMIEGKAVFRLWPLSEFGKID
jgi:signal peptidase I